MKLSSPLLIEAVVDETERPALCAAKEQLGECLSAATGADWLIELRFHSSTSSVAVNLPGQQTVAVLSLLPEVLREDDLQPTEDRWRQRLHALNGPKLAVFVCTVFRHVPDAFAQQSDSRPNTLERIRRLNLLAAELSHDAGVGVIDIDRVFAHIGARELKTDYRLGGRLAAEVAAHTIVSGILATDLDELMSPAAQEQAKKFHGSLWAIGELLERRLQQGLGVEPSGIA